MGGLECSVRFFFSSRRRHTRCSRDWSSDVCSSDLVLVNHLIFESPGTPRCAITLRRQQIFCSPRQPVQRPAVFFRRNLCIRFLRLRQCALFGQRHHKFQRRVIFLQSLQIHLR